MVEAPPSRLVPNYPHVTVRVTSSLNVVFNDVSSSITSTERESVAGRHWGVNQIAPIVVVININCIHACGGPPYPEPIHRSAT